MDLDTQDQILKALKKIKAMKIPQSQSSSTDQLEMLVMIANRFGLYDAADQLTMLIGKFSTNDPQVIHTKIRQ